MVLPVNHNVSVSLSQELLTVHFLPSVIHQQSGTVEDDNVK